jgi:hypothetical protein
MSEQQGPARGRQFGILCLFQGQWGERITRNLEEHAPGHWVISRWKAPKILPQIIDDPEDFLPDSFPAADLVLSLGEHPGLAQLVPEVARMCAAKAVIAPIDRGEWLPDGLASQLRGWLQEMGVASAFPKPFCSLTENSYNRTPQVVGYEDPIIAHFAAHFGRPAFRARVEGERLVHLEVQRDAACGCARHTAEGLAGCLLSEALEKAGMLHHHYPCLAGMTKDDNYRDTLMHVSGNLLKDALKEALQPYLKVVYLRPQGRIANQEE